MTNLRIAAAQLNSQEDVTENLTVVERLAGEARQQGASVLLLPENFAFLGGTDEQRRTVAEAVDGNGPILATLRRLAREHDLTVIGGGFPERTTNPDRPHNTAVVVGPDGEVKAVYRKIHLFDVEVGDGQTYRESAAVTPGETPVVVEIQGVPVGLSICYDIRFPELYRRLVDLGAEVLLVPAAFTLVTGKDHWHVLLRARAIESQCYVVAAAQWGTHPRGRTTFGKSLIVDPWGDVIAQASEGVGLVTATIDRERLRRVRVSLPSLRHRRLQLELA
ncbi:MAG: carbon-nitrogen hydrolase family protein [Myxococcales bacterium]|nr:carbon-nitrogen hydrolase family protein [Polyangiaceae bacterium]MDW8247728.1 carbon-nitrogen hydrolase family protein [Myxococcales bacterium]